MLRRLGRPVPGGWGTCIEPDEAAVVAAFRRRTARTDAQAPAPTTRMAMKARLKQQVDGSPRLQSLLGYSPSGTAGALIRLAKAEPSLSEDARRRWLTERMTERLDTLVRNQVAN
jgi:hypothetical protein